MIAVIFEVEPAEGALEGYMALAGSLKSEVEAIDGFISVERFESMTTPGKLVSISFWRDEAALEAWRNRPRHRAAQVKGRTGMMAGYRLRVASVIRDYGLEARAEAPADAVKIEA
ncbi:MAG: antibiotic biosynthesis monooxygenase [Pseudomonadota bacterium]